MFCPRSTTFSGPKVPPVLEREIDKVCSACGSVMRSVRRVLKAHDLESLCESQPIDAARHVPWPGATPFFRAFSAPKPLRAFGGRSRPRDIKDAAQSAGVPRRLSRKQRSADATQANDEEDAMAIITRPPATIAKKAVTVRMPEPVAETLHQYASFIGSSLDHVIVEALKLIFKKDAEFKAWQDQRRTPLPHSETERASAESAPAVAPPLFAERKRDGHRATGGESREA